MAENTCSPKLKTVVSLPASNQSSETPPDKSLIQAATGELSPETVIVPVPFSDMNATDAESYSVADSESSFAATVASDESLPSLLSDE